MSREFQKCHVLFAYSVQDPDGADLLRPQADDAAARSAQLALKSLNLSHRRLEMLLEEFFQNIHEREFCQAKITIQRSIVRDRVACSPYRSD